MKLLMIEDNTSVAEMMAMFFQKRNGKSSTPMMVKKVLLSLRKHRTALILLRLTSICQKWTACRSQKKFVKSVKLCR